MKSRIPICFFSAVLCCVTYIIFAVIAYAKIPIPFSPVHNWLSDLGNEISNPQGAIYYKIGVIACAIFLAIWFTVGLSSWRLKDPAIQSRLLVVSQVGGGLTAFALMMSALYPINHLKAHAFWSDINFLLFGISFAFSVSALRHHPGIPKILLFLGGFAAILPTLVLLVNSAYWLEWIAIGVFMLYVVLIGASTWIHRQALSQSR